MDAARELVEEHMKAAFKGKWFPLVTDGATFKHGSKAIAMKWLQAPTS